MNRIRLFIPTLLLASLTANPAHADWSDPASEIVSYADLDLSTPAGIKTLDGRIGRAVRKVCGKAYMDLATSSNVRRCRKETLASVNHQRSQALASVQSIQFSARED
jgi:UrcA family protein